jgi:hypothetical protein
MAVYVDYHHYSAPKSMDGTSYQESDQLAGVRPRFQPSSIADVNGRGLPKWTDTGIPL